MNSTPSIVVTGISGNLGRQLLPLLSSFRVVGVDFRPPQTEHSLQFEQMDLAEEASCLQLIQLFKEVRPVAVVQEVVPPAGHPVRRPVRRRRNRRPIHACGLPRQDTVVGPAAVEAAAVVCPRHRCRRR